MSQGKEPRQIFDDTKPLEREGRPCPYCGKPLKERGFKFGSQILYVGSEECQCEGARKARAEKEAEEKRLEEAERAFKRKRRINKLLRISGVKRGFKNRTFKSFQVTNSNQADAKEKAQNYANLFRRGVPRMEKNGLMIQGPVGVGKTHLASAIANQLINHLVDVVIMTPIEMMDRIKSSFSANPWEEKEEDILRDYKKTSLLIIDDLGKGNITRWSLARLYDIINARYENLMPMVVTTNEKPRELAERLTRDTKDATTSQAIVDRLKERCQVIQITGESHR